MAHTHYAENVVAVGANSGMEVKHKCCEKCGERVWAPEHCPETAYLVVCILCGGLFILGLLIAMYGSGDILILGYGLLIVGPVFYFQGLKDIRPAKVANAIEMIERLAESKKAEQVFVRYAFRFWMGRNETLNDAHVLQDAYHAYRNNGGSIKSLLISLVTSDAFLYRKAERDAK